MERRLRNTARTVAFAVLVTVVTQLIYIVVLGDVGIVEGWPLRSAVWTIEIVAFALIATASFTAMVRDPVNVYAWSALAVSGLLNMLQAGIGLSMFLPSTQAGESFAPIAGAIVAGAFLFYLLAKLLIGLAAIGFGLTLFGDERSAIKLAGGITIVAGLAATALCIFALPQGMAQIYIAGAAGTAAALFTAIAIFLASRTSG